MQSKNVSSAAFQCVCHLLLNYEYVFVFLLFYFHCNVSDIELPIGLLNEIELLEIANFMTMSVSKLWNEVTENNWVKGVYYCQWLGGLVARAFDVRLNGREFEPHTGC